MMVQFLSLYKPRLGSPACLTFPFHFCQEQEPSELRQPPNNHNNEEVDSATMDIPKRIVRKASKEFVTMAAK